MKKVANDIIVSYNFKSI